MQDQKILQLFADHISIAIENAFIFEELTLEKDSAETTLKSIGDAVITTDKNGKITRMNPVAENLTGWSESEVISSPLTKVFNIYNFDTKLPAKNPVDKVMASGDIVGLENHTVLKSRNNHEYQISDSAAPIFDENKNIQGVILVFRNVTEEYKLQEDLTKNQKRLQSILDNTPAVIFIKDSDGHYQLINKQFEKLFNISNEKIIGLTDHDIFPKDMADLFRENDLNVLKSKNYIEVEELAPHEDGPHNYISVKFPLLGSDGQAHTVCGISTDITELRKTEEALRRSQKMEAIGQLSGGIAHDFNNQLGIIIGYLDILSDSVGQDKENQNWITTASRATERCIELTRQLLSFSRKKSNETCDVNINDCIDEMKTVIARSLTPSIKVEYALAEDIWKTTVDVGEFQDALLNLVINARDALSNGGTLEIKTENIEIDKEQIPLDHNSTSTKFILIIIEDNGKGMSSEILEHIFEPFYTTKPVGKGTGLGMAMVYGFVNRHNGFIKIYSEPETGTSIKIYIPKLINNECKNNIITEDTALASGTETILIVDDEVVLLELADSYLSSLGYKTYTAINAAEALNVLNEVKHIDLLFSDVIMPGDMNGYELAKEANKLFPMLKVLLTSGFTSKETQEAQIKTYAAELLNKPYRRKDLAQRIRNELDTNK